MCLVPVYCTCATYSEKMDGARGMLLSVPGIMPCLPPWARWHFCIVKQMEKEKKNRKKRRVHYAAIQAARAKRLRKSSPNLVKLQFTSQRRVYPSSLSYCSVALWQWSATPRGPTERPSAGSQVEQFLPFVLQAQGD